MNFKKLRIQDVSDIERDQEFEHRESKPTVSSTKDALVGFDDPSAKKLGSKGAGRKRTKSGCLSM